MSPDPQPTLRAHEKPSDDGGFVGSMGLRRVVECMPDALIVVGADGAIRYANAAAESLFGRTREAILGADLGIPTLGGDKTEIDVIRPGCDTVTAEARLVETDWNGERVRLVTLRDVTDRKQAQERARQLERERQARAEAEAASKAKSEFLATMSHELRTPLNAVIGYSELLDLGITGPLTAQQRQQVGRISNSARHLLGLVNEVLDLSKVESGRLKVKNHAAPVKESVDAALAMVQTPASAHSVRIEGFGAGDGLLYEGDENRVRQILVNLLNNAVKFTPPGGTVTVECALARQPERDARLSGTGPWVVIRVKDTGIGIPAGRISSIFDPFVQVESGHTRAVDGSGLGLTISRRLARLMGGDLTARSEPGKGSVFSLWLAEATAIQREAAAWRADAPDVAAKLQGLSDIGLGVVRELPSLAAAFVDRLRAEAIIPNTHVMGTAQLADHVIGFVADIASMLLAIEEARGQPSRLVAESAVIQGFIAEQHGRQRARLGCTTDVLHREWAILREEVERVVRRAGAGMNERGVSEALIVVERFLEQGEDASVRSLEQAHAEHAAVTAEREVPVRARGESSEAATATPMRQRLTNRAPRADS